MQPYNYSTNVIQPIDRVMQMMDMARKKKQQKFSNEMQERGADFTEETGRAQMKNADRRLDQVDRNFERGVETSDRDFAFGERKFEYGAERDEVMDGYRDRGLEMQERGLDQADERIDQADRRLSAQEIQARETRQRAKAAREDMAVLAANPNAKPEDYAAMIGKHPEMAQELKSGYEILNKADQRNAKREAVQVYGALQGGNVETAKDLLERRKEAAKASGDQKGLASADAMLKMIEMNPDAGKTAAGLFLASVSDGTDLAYTLGALEKLEPGNTSADIRSLGDIGRDGGLSQAAINRTLAGTRGQTMEQRTAAIQAAVAAKQAKDGSGGDIFGGTKAEEPGQTEEKPKPAATATAKPDPVEFFSQPVAQGIKDGFTVAGPNGEKYTARNGKWKKVD